MREIKAREAGAILWLMLAAAALFSVLHAQDKPFWYDEICTVIVCRLHGASEIWKALDGAADTNPPLFYAVARLARLFVADDHLGYRLPSILGLLGTVWWVYAAIARRATRLSALVGAAFILCTPLAAYAYEARPYALMVGCVAAAILAWQRIDDSPLYAAGVAVALAAAVSFHYYSILVWPAFVLAEMSVWALRRRPRVAAWAALVAGALPLLFFGTLLRDLRRYYGSNFWAHPGLKQIFLAHNWLFDLSGYWGWIFAACLTAAFLYLTREHVSGGNNGNPVPAGERVLTVTLLWLPVIAVAAAKVGHGGMTERYMLPAVLGGALALGYVADKVPASGRALLLILLMANYTLSTGTVVRNALTGTLFAPRAAAAQRVQAIATQSGEPALPIVISSGSWYLPMAYYTAPGMNAKLYSIADPALAAASIGTDSIDLALLVLQRYFPLQIADYAGFIAAHPRFLLVTGGPFDWLTARLAHDGHTVTLLSTGETSVYRVTVKP